ncbi:MAG TPA: phosphoribosylglycinamide formyltransferase [Ignavibacteriales bacterium]|nr:phosphoribosylglycinamide formyltransferase [Ignavibacteriales bacterium]HOL81115.1 phosphoribosylglycinamide formyltransferase [Ignavibacteriales bacterium]HOM65219.1 phosphoribosylglycinamide formyltransferase [Ignavibacteriales bacterium]HPD66511.1 phosphoribosylglycinamide formyltransferase [Ignavibacteriales bacterium]HPP33529.1 phosphoribosylglycinamide formyltransferase [Ignavibacteriales bacterium]
MYNLGVLVSGGGTNLQAIIDSIESGFLKNVKISVVISSNSKAYALVRCKKHNINYEIISKKQFSSQVDFENKIINVLNENKVDLVILAGFMTILSSHLINAFKDRILNIHPSLLPKFGGKGYFGIKVHEKVLEAKEKITGATVHFVTDEVDAGPIILQKSIPVLENDTPETLQKRVLEECEWKIYPEAIKKVIEELDRKK